MIKFQGTDKVRILDRPIRHRYLTRSRERTMAKETIARAEQIEKNQQELREILTRDYEEHREQMA